MSAREFNFDGLIGPTHNYAGLSPGNLASTKSVGRMSHPRKAALQGLAKMAMLHAMGVPQAILPPQPRPDLDWLRRLGFEGDDARVIERANREAPRMLAAAYSASSMWTANAATVIPSSDTHDGRLHFIPANLSSEIHRALETPHTSELLRTVFPDASLFAHHAPLPIPGDEGAANHTRLTTAYGEPGLHVFTYGLPRGASSSPSVARDQRIPVRHQARQTEEASRAAARLTLREGESSIYLQQRPEAIDAGVFHNDVIATGDRDLVFLHEDSFVDQRRALEQLEATFEARYDRPLRIVEVPRAALPLSLAVETYLFNCQIVARANGRTAWIGPIECDEDPETAALLGDLTSGGGPFDELHFVDLRESMQNGGGPACLRLRVVLSDAERAATHPGVFFDEPLHERLVRVIEEHYREELYPEDLGDPAFVDEARAALDAMTTAMGLGSVYSQQRA